MNLILSQHVYVRGVDVVFFFFDMISIVPGPFPIYFQFIGLGSLDVTKESFRIVRV